jgi:hypothetical protein
MAVMYLQICNLVDRRKENKCINKTANKAKGGTSSNCFIPRLINLLLSLYKRTTTRRIYNNMNIKLKSINKPYVKVDQYLNLQLIFKSDSRKELHQASIPKA